VSQTRFASKYAPFSVTIQHDIAEHYATGQSRVIQQMVIADFRPGGLEPFEREFVLNHWSFQGLFQNLDEVTPVPPDHRIGLFDSVQQALEKAWPDEIRELAEKKLLKEQVYDTYIALPATAVPPPWPNYDDYKGTVGQLLKKLEDDGHDLRLVLEYERAAQQRQALIDALQAKVDGFEQEPGREEEQVVVA